MKKHRCRCFLKRAGRVAAVACGGVLLLVVAGCATAPELSLWRDEAPAKKALRAYVEAVTDKGSPDYIPPAARVAVFDFDGTLFCETDPTYFDWLLYEHRVLDDPSYKPTDEQRKAAIASRTRTSIPGLTPDRERLIVEVYKGMTLDEFAAYVHAFMEEPQPGFTGLKRGAAYYLPMLEVVKLLMAKISACTCAAGRTVCSCARWCRP